MDRSFKGVVLGVSLSVSAFAISAVNTCQLLASVLGVTGAADAGHPWNGPVYLGGAVFWFGMGILIAVLTGHQFGRIK